MRGGHADERDGIDVEEAGDQARGEGDTEEDELVKTLEGRGERVGLVGGVGRGGGEGGGGRVGVSSL